MTRRTDLRPARNSATASALAQWPHAQRKCLDAPQHEEAVEQSGDRTDRVLQKRQPLGQFGVLADDSNATNHVGVAVQILGRRVDNRAATMVERALHIGTGEGVVGGGPDAMLAADRGDSREIDKLQHRVGRGLDPDEARLCTDRRFDRLRLGHVDTRQH